MKRTQPSVLLVTALGAGVIAFLIERWLQGSAAPIIVPPVTLAIALLAIGAIVLALAWPVRQAVKGKQHVDFRHATSVLGLAKASSLVAALFGGAVAGVLVYLLTRPVVAAHVVGIDLVSMGAAILLLIAALLAESWCVLPPDDEHETGVTSAA